MRPWFFSLALVLAWSGCSAEPNKSQYVGAVVKAECADVTGSAKQDCRHDVMRRFIKMSFEEMKAKYPAPPPPDRPSC